MARNQLKNLRGKVDGYEKKANSIIDILMKAYSLYEEDELKGSQGGYQIDLKAIRAKRVDQWTNGQARLVVNALLQQLSSFLGRKQLGLPPPIRS